MELITMLPKFLILLVCLLPTLAVSDNRKELSVQFEYKLEVDDVQDQLGSSQHVVDEVDATILDAMQTDLPKGREEEELNDFPDIKFEDIQSSIYTECFSETDECSIIMSTIKLSYVSDMSENTLEFVTLRLAQSFINDFNKRKSGVQTKYMFPKMVETSFQFTLKGVRREMNKQEIKIFESTVMEVFGSVLFKVEGNTDVVNAQFMYQGKKTKSLETFLTFTGLCRTCTGNTFGQIIKVILESTMHHFEEKLKDNARVIGSTIFDGLTSVKFIEPLEPEQLSPLDPKDLFGLSYDVDIAVDNVQTSSSLHPWFHWMGICVIVCACGAIFYEIRQDHLRALEENNARSDPPVEEIFDMEQSVESPQNDLQAYYSDGEMAHSSCIF